MQIGEITTSASNRVKFLTVLSTNKNFTLLFLLFISSLGHACTGEDRHFIDEYKIELRAKHAGQSLDFDRISPESKNWPARQGLIILVVPYLFDANPENKRFLGLGIAIAQPSSGRNLSKYDQSPISTVDAIFPIAVRIDTAFYKLNSDQVAFGLVIDQRNSSGVNPFAEEMESLYVQDGGKINNILDGMVIYRSSGEGDGDCAFEAKRKTSILSMLSSNSNGYHDINVNQETEIIKNYIHGKSCRATTNALDSRSYRLRFRNKRYEIPSDLVSGSLTTPR